MIALKKIILALVVASLAVLLVRCVPVVFMFSWESCGEDDSHVKRMRSYSQEQLAELFDDVMALPEKYPYTNLTPYSNPPIPDNLANLKATYIDVGGPSDTVFIALTKCNVSVGVKMWFRPDDHGRKTIKLSWYNPTEENPYGESSEILWSE